MRWNGLCEMVSSQRAASPKEAAWLWFSRLPWQCWVVGHHVARYLFLQPPSFLSWPAE